MNKQPRMQTSFALLTLTLVVLLSGSSVADEAEPESAVIRRRPAAVLVHSSDGPFVFSPTDSVRSMFFGAEDAGRAAKALQDARSKQPDAVLLVEVSGTITVDDVPLRVPSRTCLIFLPGGGSDGGRRRERGMSRRNCRRASLSAFRLGSEPWRSMD